MPSKKKNPKTPTSKPSNSDQTNHFSSPSPLSSSPFDPTSTQLLSALDEASAQFPSLISTSAFIGQVSDDAVSNSRGCKVWLSESAMVSSSISPGSLVSVSLSSSDKVLSGFPLSALPDECATHFGFEVTDNLENEAGKFFALATVFPSCKVLKNGVRLSSDLSHTLGCPVSGRILFVYPVKFDTLTVKENGNRYSPAVSCISLERSKDICLSPVYLKGKVEIDSVTMSNDDLSNEVAYRHVENMQISSPKTPSLSESKVSSPCSVQSRTSNFDKLVRMRTQISHASIDAVDMEEFLRDDSSRKLLETCVASWLSSRSLLSGNYVAVPVLSKLCVFHVGSKRLSPKTEILDSKNNGFPAPDSDIKKDMVSAFAIDWGTKIHLVLPENQVVESSVRSTLAHQEIKNGSIRHNMEANIFKLGGLSKEFAVLKDIIVSSAVQVTVASWGLRPTKGVLLHGPPGTGKTNLARECAHDAGVNMFSVNGPEIISQYHGETEKALHEVFENASKASPSVVFIDELDAIAPARKDGGDELSQRMVATLLNLMDGVSRTDGVLIIAATNRLDSIEPALRRPGRFDREIEIGVPSPRQRHEILLALLSEKKHSLSDKDIQDLAMATHGFVGADLAALCNEAALVRLRQNRKLITLHG